MDDADFAAADVGFLRNLPRLITRHPGLALHRDTKLEDTCIKRLQRLGLLRCIIDQEHSSRDFHMAELQLTDAGRAVLARGK